MNLGGTKRRLTVRARMAIVFSVVFFIIGLILVGAMYIQLDRILAQNLGVSARLHDVSLPTMELPTELPSYGRTEPQSGSPNEIRQMVDLQFAYARNETLRDMLVSCLVLLGLLGASAGGIGWSLAGRFLRPLRDITRTAQRIAGQTLHQRIALDGPNDEIKDLADTLDAMLERLDRSFESQQRFIANASHELRTPLALNRTLIEVEMLRSPPSRSQLKDLGRKLIDINDRHEKLIEGLLALAISDQPVSADSQVNLADLVRQVLEEGKWTAGESTQDTRTELADVVVNGDQLLLERAVHNLVENAVRYNIPQSGWIEISTASDGDFAVLTVENTGPVVPAEDVPALLEPFRRVSGTDRLAASNQAGTKRGAGLGLSIVSSVARAHEGEVAVTARPDGGLVASLLLPLQSEPR